MQSEVSVVIPTLGSSPYLQQAVESALAEEPAEVVVVVNGGAEVEVAGARVIRRAERGRSAARNEGVEAARTPYVAFLDDDDAALPGRLERQREPLARDPGAVLSFGRVRVVLPNVIIRFILATWRWRSGSCRAGRSGSATTSRRRSTAAAQTRRPGS